MHFCVPLPEFLIQYIRGRACISNKFPGMADAPDLETTSEKHWSIVNKALCERNWCEMWSLVLEYLLSVWDLPFI